MPFFEDLKQQVNDYLDAKEVAKLRGTVATILRERENLKGWTEKELRLTTLAFKDDIKKGASLDSILVQSYAVMCEAARRILGKVPYDVQILGGLVIHKGKVAEMKAGEGKTLTETMPVFLNALSGRGVHIITTNDYLAERDQKQMGMLYDYLGLSSAFVTSDMKNDARRKAYASDITYVTNQEIGFDYLRDNLVFERSERVLRAEHPLNFGIVDEIDSILIDESRTPLIIAEPVKEERGLYDLFTKIVKKLKEAEDFTVDYKNKQVAMTNEGLDKVESMVGGKVFSKDNPMYVFYLDVCLKAQIIFEKDRDYIISKDGVEIVDEFTGRVLPGRRFTDGVHQAIEAKENVAVKEADRTVAAITFQNFFPMYEKLSGMSGTVMRSRDEFQKVYKLEVVQIPTNKPLARLEKNDLYFKTEKGKFTGMMKKIAEIHSKGQPMLIGARNVEIAHKVSKLLNDNNFPHQLLTAADNRSEAAKIEQAGQEEMITVATNMAGRGTDIILGPGVDKMGGLYVLGTERHESRRIDDQLVGRAGRQGEPGSSQFFVSMEDEIMQLFGSEKIIDAMEAYDIPEDEYISGPSLDAAFKRAQDFVESKNYDARLYLYKYDRVTNYQRTVVYKLREFLLENEVSSKKFLDDAVFSVVEEIFKLEQPDIISGQLKEVFKIDIKTEELKSAFGHRRNPNNPERQLIRKKF
ncbi:MAG: preprotein translocase subunit SecA, partial [Candidatus Doudnabacteria bacterium]|nr:preprotein translocase subunit SecA [Candidatus Doudnabacteria bacterium]